MAGGKGLPRLPRRKPREPEVDYWSRIVGTTLTAWDVAKLKELRNEYSALLKKGFPLIRLANYARLLRVLDSAGKRAKEGGESTLAEDRFIVRVQRDIDRMESKMDLALNRRAFSQVSDDDKESEQEVRGEGDPMEGW